MPNIANIYYHSVAPQPNPDWILNHNTLLLRYFEDQMNYLTRNGYKTVHLDDIFIHQSIIGPKNVWLSFDDGYLDNGFMFIQSFEELGIKITIFVTPEFVDPRDLRRPNLDDVWLNKVTMKDLPNAGFLSWREMREMEESGLVDIQSHTFNPYQMGDLQPILNFFTTHLLIHCIQSLTDKKHSNHFIWKLKDLIFNCLMVSQF
jgi:peptidoglycan/xylan/chitin deacetylase (PgdA/CDA1 family)